MFLQRSYKIICLPVIIEETFPVFEIYLERNKTLLYYEQCKNT